MDNNNCLLTVNNGWVLMAVMKDYEGQTITFYCRKGLKSKDIVQALAYWVKFESLLWFQFK